MIGQSDGASAEYFTYDGLGSVRQVVNDMGEVLLAQSFDPYGNPYVHSGDGVTSWGFTGEQTDANGLVFLRARYYQPSEGRFLQRDPWGSREYDQTQMAKTRGAGLTQSKDTPGTGKWYTLGDEPEDYRAIEMGIY